MCTFTWNGCATTAIVLPSPGSYPTIELTDITDDEIDAYYFMGSDKIGCMDKRALNYLNTAVLNNGYCIYANNPELEIKDLELYSDPGVISIIINDH